MSRVGRKPSIYDVKLTRLDGTKTVLDSYHGKVIINNEYLKCVRFYASVSWA